MSWFDHALQGLRHGARLLIKNPGFTAIAVLSIACGTGANVAVFSSTDALLLRPLPIHDLDSAAPVYDAQTIEVFYRAQATGLGDVIMTLVGAIGFMGLTITLVGLYGLVSYAVNRRTREIGIRIAIGATHGRVLRMLLRQGLTPAWVGMVAGVVLSVVTARLMLTVVETTATLRPVIMLVVVPVLVTVTLLAAFVPARPAAKADPTVALRYE